MVFDTATSRGRRGGDVVDGADDAADDDETTAAAAALLEAAAATLAATSESAEAIREASAELAMALASIDQSLIALSRRENTTTIECERFFGFLMGIERKKNLEKKHTIDFQCRVVKKEETMALSAF